MRGIYGSLGAELRTVLPVVMVVVIELIMTLITVVVGFAVTCGRLEQSPSKSYLKFEALAVELEIVVDVVVTTTVDVGWEIMHEHAPLSRELWNSLSCVGIAINRCLFTNAAPV